MRNSHPPRVFISTALAISTALVLALASGKAEAHWCDSQWASSYNLLIRPETSMVSVPASGSATLNLHVQNNMGYPLPNFDLRVSLSGATVSARLVDNLKVSGTLLPGEKARYAITVSKAGGGTVSAEDMNFTVKFGEGTQSRCYPTGSGAKAVAVVNPDGTVYPPSPLPGIGTLACTDRGQQAISLVFSAVADFETDGSGLDKLMSLYCAGRASWSSSSSAVIPSYCPSPTATANCPASRPSASGTKYDYAHLWTAGELAVRKSALGNRLPTLRSRLRCGVNDGRVVFAGYTLFVLGYLGDDAAARTFMQSKVEDADLGLIAKAALYLAGNPADKSDYRADVEACLTSSNFYAKTACAAALGIADSNDEAVGNILIPNAKFTQPDTDDEGKGLYASHLLELVAWDRRGWAAKGADRGGVSFYNDPGTAGNAGRGGDRGGGGAIGKGGTSGSGGAAGSAGAAGTGGARGEGGATGKGGAAGKDGAAGDVSSGGGSEGGRSGGTAGRGGVTGSGGALGDGGRYGTGGARESGGSAGGGGTTGSGGGGVSTAKTSAGSGCQCNLKGRSRTGP